MFEHVTMSSYRYESRILCNDNICGIVRSGILVAHVHQCISCLPKRKLHGKLHGRSGWVSDSCRLDSLVRVILADRNLHQAARIRCGNCEWPNPERIRQSDGKKEEAAREAATETYGRSTKGETGKYRKAETIGPASIEAETATESASTTRTTTKSIIAANGFEGFAIIADRV